MYVKYILGILYNTYSDKRGVQALNLVYHPIIMRNLIKIKLNNRV
jgi:hypothetical protein